jgi:hypothetical protein
MCHMPLYKQKKLRVSRLLFEECNKLLFIGDRDEAWSYFGLKPSDAHREIEDYLKLAKDSCKEGECLDLKFDKLAGLYAQLILSNFKLLWGEHCLDELYS